jgi:hypothetical protein
MKPIKAVSAEFKSFPNFHFHILLAEEDEVIVARCLDFSIASHGETEMESLQSLSDSIIDYLDHAIKNRALDQAIDPESDELWNIYRQLELEQERSSLKKLSNLFSSVPMDDVVYA